MTENQPTSSSIFSTAWNDVSEEDAVYTRVSVSALLALLFGAVSFLVFLTPWLFFLSVLGILFSMASLVMIAGSDGGLTGRRVAILGLTLSVVSLIAVGMHWPTYHYAVRHEADRFFRIWFEQLAENNVPIAKGLTSFYWERGIPKDSETWWQEQYKNVYAHRSIHNYMDNRLVRVLLALGDTAKISYYRNLGVISGDDEDTVINVYAVTYPVTDGEQKGKMETFFIKMTGKRQFPSGDIKSAGWKLEGLPVLYVPEEYKATATTPSQGAATTQKSEPF